MGGAGIRNEVNTVEDIGGAIKMRMPGLGGEVLAPCWHDCCGVAGRSVPGPAGCTIDATEWVGPRLDLTFGFLQSGKFY